MKNAQPDRLIHQPIRTRIMAALAPLARGSLLEFRDLKTLTEATDGNLGSHLTALETAGYVRISKDFHGKRPRTRVGMTEQGHAAFDAYRSYLRTLLDA
ncbi:transcriptional regulator [Iodidimonas gelatinilytica]|uniref:Transcriptional regulator n=1 Tax=Iodidimonas gelatinilytica TaxID=1236966 RepID=A0A5A7MW30_9PROT|nr:transcriptional regulator [Iodidimonas gelatinilytica]GEQ99065.1 transcriptional regulator [Iodidimonas gelatinilytica]GER00750.1 transcriptional regulator [Iodidimonas gelatinilytica]